MIDANLAPADLTLSNASVAENQAVGTLVGNFTTTDGEAPASPFTYTLVTGTGSTNNSSFAIAGDQLKTNAVFNYETKSSYAIRVRTTDAGGLWYEEAFVVTVQPVSDPPTLDPLGDLDIPEDSLEIVVPLTGITAGAGDMQPLYVAAVSSAPAIIPTPTVAYVSPEVRGTLRFTPLPNAFGSVVVTVFVEDGGADGDLGTPSDNAVVSETFSVRVRAVQDPPAASGDVFTAQENHTLDVSAPGVLANDQDVEGDSLSAFLVHPTTHGALQLHADGSFTYVPVERFNREDSFEYYADDGTDRSTTVTVTIVVQTAYPWHNSVDRLNVNDDAYISPIDALLVVNELNTNGDHKLALDRPRPLTKPFLDVSCDGQVSPVDALLVINYLNGGGSAEGEEEVPEAIRLGGSVLSEAVSSVTSPLTSSRKSPLRTVAKRGSAAWCAHPISFRKAVSHRRRPPPSPFSMTSQTPI